MDHLTLIRSYFENILSNKNPQVASEILTDDVKCLLPNGDVSIGIEPILEAVAGASAAFPHRDISLDKVITEDSSSAVVYTLAMQHIGQYGEYEPTDKIVSITGVDIFEFTNDRISSISVFYNPETIAEQLS